MYKIVVKILIWESDVRITFFEKSGPTDKHYTKFRFKFVANFCCWIFNNGNNYFNTYRVVKINKINLSENQ